MVVVDVVVRKAAGDEADRCICREYEGKGGWVRRKPSIGM